MHKAYFADSAVNGGTIGEDIELLNLSTLHSGGSYMSCRGWRYTADRSPES